MMDIDDIHAMQWAIDTIKRNCPCAYDMNNYEGFCHPTNVEEPDCMSCWLSAINEYLENR